MNRVKNMMNFLEFSLTQSVELQNSFTQTMPNVRDDYY